MHFVASTAIIAFCLLEMGNGIKRKLLTHYSNYGKLAKEEGNFYHPIQKYIQKLKKIPII